MRLGSARGVALRACRAPRDHNTLNRIASHLWLSQGAFFLLLTVLQYEPHKLAGLFSPGMPRVGLVHFQFHGLMEKKLPKLTKHLEEQGLHPTIFASQVRGC